MPRLGARVANFRKTARVRRSQRSGSEEGPHHRGTEKHRGTQRKSEGRESTARHPSSPSSSVSLCALSPFTLHPSLFDGIGSIVPRDSFSNRTNSSAATTVSPTQSPHHRPTT